MTAARNVTATFAPIPANYMFVTSTTHTGSLGGLAGADSICQTRASAAGLGGTYRAYLSTPTVNAISRLGSASGWIRKDGKPVANTTAELASGHLYYPPRITETGVDVGTGDAWTASTASGQFNTQYASCADWTSASTTIFAKTGWAYANSSMFSSISATNCSVAKRLYCFGVDNQAVVAPPVVNARRAFTTNATWIPGGGLSGADALCASEASTAGLSGTYKALLPTTTASAISRFTTGGTSLTWARPDHTLITATSAVLATANLMYLDAAPNSNAANTTWLGNTGIWGGTVDLATVGTATTTCSNWTSNLSTSTGMTGKAGATHVKTWFQDTSNACNATHLHLVCLQQ
jgi:hypothetical protein